jgi:hypothetical protein
MTEPTTNPPVPPADPEDIAVAPEDGQPDQYVGEEVEYDFDAPDPEVG